MVCFTPLKAYRGHGGGVVFSSKEGFGDLPLDLPCGQCIGCRIRRAQDWVVRCVHESSQHETSSFLTLTYDQVNVPSNGSLDHRHFQLFAKRMRKANRPFRYLVAGEYGGQTYRPHYHACVFGQDFSRDRTIWRTQPHILYESPELNELWGLGHCTIGALTPETVGYVAQYTVKKLTGDQAEEAYTRLDLDTGEEYQVKPEYAAMSRRPGIGESWFRRYHTDVFPSDEVIISSGGGSGVSPTKASGYKRVRPPRYYDKLHEGDNPAAHLALSSQRRARVLEAPLSDQLRHAKEVISTASVSLKPRRL